MQVRKKMPDEGFEPWTLCLTALVQCKTIVLKNPMNLEIKVYKDYSFHFKTTGYKPQESI